MLRLLNALRWAYAWLAIGAFWCLIRISPKRAIRVLHSIPQDGQWALVLEGLGHEAAAERLRARRRRLVARYAARGYGWAVRMQREGAA